MKKIDIEEIMKEIREDIQQKEYVETKVNFVNGMQNSNLVYFYNWDELQQFVSIINANYEIPSKYPLYGNRFVQLIKKVIRKTVLFVIRPIVREQNEFNANVTRSFNQLLGYIEQQKDEIQYYNNTLELLEERVRELEKKNNQ